jgi:hypothetical protein
VRLFHFTSSNTDLRFDEFNRVGMARSALQHAREYATQAEALFEQARQFIPEIKPIPPVHIPKG